MIAHCQCYLSIPILYLFVICVFQVSTFPVFQERVKLSVDGCLNRPMTHLWEIKQKPRKNKTNDAFEKGNTHEFQLKSEYRSKTKGKHHQNCMPKLPEQWSTSYHQLTKCIMRSALNFIRKMKKNKTVKKSISGMPSTNVEWALFPFPLLLLFGRCTGREMVNS